MSTSFETKCEILGDFWFEHRKEEEFAEFVEYCNIGLPLAFMVDNGQATITEDGKEFINFAWETFCASLFLDSEDKFENAHDMLYQFGTQRFEMIDPYKPKYFA